MQRSKRPSRAASDGTLAGPATIKQVAIRAGCSIATVSRAINNPDRVADGVRERILVIVKELGYVANSAARTLRHKQSGLIGVVIPSFKSTVYAAFSEAIEGCLNQNGYSLYLASSDYDLSREYAQAKVMVQRGVEGIIFVGIKRHKELDDLLQTAGVQRVDTYVYDPSSRNSTIGIDNERIPNIMLDHLYGLGHRDICMVAGRTKDNDRATHRANGFMSGLRRLGLPAERSRLTEGAYTIDAGRTGLKKLLAAHKPTAIVCGSDIQALGVMIECGERGISIPDDLSIASTDDLEFSPHLAPALTTTRLPSAEMGVRATEHLISKCRGSREVAHICFETELVVRATTASIKRRRIKAV